MHEIAETVSVFLHLRNDAVDFTPVPNFKQATGGVGEHFFGEAVDHLWFALEEHRFVFSEILNFATIRENRGGIDRESLFGLLIELGVIIAPAADRVEIFQRKSHRVDFLMTTSARFLIPVGGELVFECRGSAQGG